MLLGHCWRLGMQHRMHTGNVFQPQGMVFQPQAGTDRDFRAQIGISGLCSLSHHTPTFTPDSEPPQIRQPSISHPGKGDPNTKTASPRPCSSVLGIHPQLYI